MIHIVHELRRARGPKKKKEILEKYRDYPEWQRFLRLTYDPHLNFWVSAPDDKTFYGPNDDVDYSEMFHDINLLIFRQVRGDEARRYARQLSEKYGEIFRIALDRTLRAGISEKTINSVYGDIIPTFPLMLAKDVPIKRFPVMSSIKYDGVRVLVFVSDTDIDIRTRAGKELPIESLIETMQQQPNGVYDGELVAGNGLQESRTKITGQVNKVLKGTLDDLEGYKYCVFDYVSWEEWEAKQSSTPYERRRGFLMENVKSESNLLITPVYMLSSLLDVEEDFRRKLSAGYEGLILRYPGDPYIWDRTPHLIKKKAIKDATLTCVGIQEGTGKYEGLIGSLICKGIVNRKTVEVKVGSGLSDWDRERDPDDFIGHLVEVEYNDIVRAKNSDFSSLFLPRFKRIRKEQDT